MDQDGHETQRPVSQDGQKAEATFWEVFSETNSTDLARLLPWSISITANPGAIPICYKNKALATTMQWRVDAPVATTTLESEGSQAALGLHLFQFFLCQTFPLSVLPQSGSHLQGSSLIAWYIKLDCSPSGEPNDWPHKRVHAKIAEANVSSGHSTPQGDGVPPKSTLETPNKGMVASGSTGEHDSEDNTDHYGDESNQHESRENASNSNFKSASGNCLTCLDTEEVAVRTVWKRFWKKVWSSWSIARGCLWSEAQLKWIQDSHQAVWGSDYEIIKTEWELALMQDHTSFKVNKISVRTYQLLWIKEATHLKIPT